MQSFGFSGELLLADVLLDVVERTDAAKPFAHALGICRLGLEDLAPCVCLILRSR